MICYENGVIKQQLLIHLLDSKQIQTLLFGIDKCKKVGEYEGKYCQGSKCQKLKIYSWTKLKMIDKGRC